MLHKSPPVLSVAASFLRFTTEMMFWNVPYPPPSPTRRDGGCSCQRTRETQRGSRAKARPEVAMNNLQVYGNRRGAAWALSRGLLSPTDIPRHADARVGLRPRKQLIGPELDLQRKPSYRRTSTFEVNCFMLYNNRLSQPKPKLNPPQICTALGNNKLYINRRS